MPVMLVTNVRPEFKKSNPFIRCNIQHSSRFCLEFCPNIRLELIKANCSLGAT